MRLVMKNMQDGIYTVTPKVAKEWLDTMGVNRNLRLSVVKRYAKDMTEGHWFMTKDPIKFDEYGHMCDGQHRLYAVIESGITIEFFVVFNIKEEATRTVDIGIRRQPSDHFKLAGIENASDVSASILWVWRYKNNLMTGYFGANMPSLTERLNFYFEHENLQESVQYGRMTQKLMHRNLGIALHYLFTEKDRTIANNFFIRLGSGEHIEKNNPIHRLRERLIDNMHKKAKLSDVDIAALVIKAWNAERKGRKLFYLKWATVGQNTEEFPVIQ